MSKKCVLCKSFAKPECTGSVHASSSNMCVSVFCNVYYYSIKYQYSVGS